MALYRFILRAHWRSRRRWVLFILMLMAVLGSWGVFQQAAQQEREVAIAADKLNRQLLKDVPLTVLKQLDLGKLPDELAKSGDPSPKKDLIMSKGAMKGNFGLLPGTVNPGKGGVLPISDRYGSVSLTEALKQRTRLDQYLVRAGLPLKSTRYGTENWSFLVSLMPLLTSIFGVLILTAMIMVEDLADSRSRRLMLITSLPVPKVKLVATQLLVFLTDLGIFVVGMLSVGFGYAWLQGGSSTADYPVLTRINGQLSLVSSWQVVLICVGLYIVSCTIVYIAVRLVMHLLRQIKNLVGQMVILIVSYWLVLSQVAISLLPHLFGFSWLAWFPGSYLQASRLIFGTDYLEMGQFLLVSLERYQGVSVFLSLGVGDLDYFNGASLAHLFSDKGIPLIGLHGAIGLLIGSGVLLLGILMHQSQRENRLR